MLMTQRVEKAGSGLVLLCPQRSLVSQVCDKIIGDSARFRLCC